MAQLAVTTLTPLSSTGVSFGLVASSSTGDKFVNSGHEMVLFQNSSSQGAGTAITVTFTAQGIDNFGGSPSLHNQQVTIASSSMGLTAVGPFRTAIYNDAAGFLNMTYSASGLAVQVVAIAPQS